MRSELTNMGNHRVRAAEIQNAIMWNTLVEHKHPLLKTKMEPFDFDNPPTDPEILFANMSQMMLEKKGVGLSANQVGLPFNMFVLGDVPQIENGLKMACFNPMIMSVGEEEVMMKEGCLTYPWIFLSIKRPRKCVGKYVDENGVVKEATMDGMVSRIYQHEYEHTLGRVFLEKVSKLKLDMARKRAVKAINRAKRNADRRKTL